MSDNTESPASELASVEHRKPQFSGLPRTWLGWLAIILAAGFWLPIFPFLPIMAIAGHFLLCLVPWLLCLAGSFIASLVALISKRERSWLVWLSMVSEPFGLWLVIAWLIPYWQCDSC